MKLLLVSLLFVSSSISADLYNGTPALGPLTELLVPESKTNHSVEKKEETSHKQQKTDKTGNKIAVQQIAQGNTPVSPNTGKIKQSDSKKPKNSDSDSKTRSPWERGLKILQDISNPIIAVATTLAAIFAFFAWLSSRRSNRLQYRPYFEFVGAEIKWFEGLPSYEPCASFYLAVKNIGNSPAFDLSSIEVDHFFVKYPRNRSLKIDKTRFDLPAETKRAECKEDKAPHSVDCNALFPEPGICRKIVSPGEVVELVIIIPLDKLPAGVRNTQPIEEANTAYRASGTFTFRDSFSKDIRGCNYLVLRKASNFIGDGSSLRSSIGTAGNVTEK